MITTARRHPGAGLRALAVVLVVAALAGCAAGSDAGETVGTIREIPGGSALTVPALWAAKQSDGSTIGGIEPAEVDVLENGDGTFTVDLSTIIARGAGPQWKAATAQAAAVGTLLSASDPAKVDLGFTITGPIDGPSAGGLLTVGVLAAISQESLLPNVTMTGAISPDGSIVPVGYVPTKVASAAKAGFTKVVVPFGEIKVPRDDGTSQDLADYASSLGVTVVPVRTVTEAYEQLTGKAYAEMPAAPVVASRQTGTAIIVTASRMRDRLALAIRQVPPGTDPKTVALAESALPRIELALAARRWDRAYGIGAFAYLQLARASGAARVRDSIARTGAARTEQALRLALASALREATAARDSAIASARPTLEQSIYLPGALGWVTYAIASYRGILLELEKEHDNTALITAGRILSENAVGVQDMLPDSLQVLNAMPARTTISPEDLRTFLTGYTSLLRNAGKANTDYLTAIAGGPLVADGTVSDDGLIGANQALQSSMSTSLIQPESAAAALAQCADALTFYVISNGLVSGHQSYALAGGEEGELISPTPLTLDAAVDTGAITVEAYSADLRSRKLTVGYPLWSSRWGRAAAVEYRDSTHATDSAWIALNEIWYDVVSMYMLYAKSQDSTPSD